MLRSLTFKAWGFFVKKLLNIFYQTNNFGLLG